MSQRRWHQNTDWSDWSDWGWSYPSWHHDWHEWHGWQEPIRQPRRQLPRQRKHKVGVYFGTFDPIHENHVGLAKFACDHGYVDRVYFVVNGDNPMKLLAVSYQERLHLVQRRLELEDDARLRLFNLSREEAQQMRWRDREEIGERIRNEAEKEFGKVQVFQLQGQDSFEKAVFRSGPKGGKGEGKHGKGIWSTRTHFLVFPRVGASSSVQVPGQMRQRVTVAQDYVDPQPLSSTDIRASAAESSLESKVHPRLLEDVLQMYTRRRRFLLLFLGSSLGRELEKAFGFYHLSGGDAYRAAQSRTSTIAVQK